MFFLFICVPLNLFIAQMIPTSSNLIINGWVVQHFDIHKYKFLVLIINSIYNMYTNIKLKLKICVQLLDKSVHIRPCQT